MGRRAGKLKVELIENKKARILAFKRRKECLLKKTKELSTLCDVNACLLLHAPEHESPSVWPPNDPTLVGRLIHHNRAKNSKNADESAQFGFLPEIKAKLIEAQLQIDRLKSERDRQRELMDDVDDDGKAQQFAVDVQKNAQLGRAQIGQGELMDDAEQQDLDFDEQDQLVRASDQQQQDQHAVGLDNLYRYPQQQQYQLMDNADQQQQFGHSMDQLMDNADQQQQFGHSMDLDGLMMPPLDVADYDVEEWAQEEDLFGRSSSSMMPSAPDQLMMMMDDVITADQSFCNGMAGFHEEEEGASCSTQTAGGEAVQEWYEDDYDLIAQLQTPPRLTWQWTDLDHNLWV